MRPFHQQYTGFLARGDLEGPFDVTKMRVEDRLRLSILHPAAKPSRRRYLTDIRSRIVCFKNMSEPRSAITTPIN